MAVRQDGDTWSFERREGVGVWTIHDIEGFFEREAVDGRRHFTRTAEGLAGAVVVLDDTTSISREMQTQVGDAWSRAIAETAVDRVALVSDGIRAMAVKSNVKASDTDLKALDDVEDAVAWAVGPGR